VGAKRPPFSLKIHNPLIHQSTISIVHLSCPEPVLVNDIFLAIRDECQTRRFARAIFLAFWLSGFLAFWLSGFLAFLSVFRTTRCAGAREPM
jgi:hypothetical protein